MAFCLQSIILVTLMSLVTIGSCTKCYQCTSQNDVKCGATFTSAIQPVDCSTDAYKSFNQLFGYAILPSEAFGGIMGSPRYCHTITMESGTVVRTCLDTDANNKDKTCKTIMDATAALPAGAKVKSCIACNKDNCNAAGALSFSLPLFALTLIISYLVYKQ